MATSRFLGVQYRAQVGVLSAQYGLFSNGAHEAPVNGVVGSYEFTEAARFHGDGGFIVNAEMRRINSIGQDVNFRLYLFTDLAGVIAAQGLALDFNVADPAWIGYMDFMSSDAMTYPHGGNNSKTNIVQLQNPMGFRTETTTKSIFGVMTTLDDVSGFALPLQTYDSATVKIDIAY